MELWIIYQEKYEKNNAIPEFMRKVAIKKGFDCQIKFINKFTYNAEKGKWLYDSKEITRLPPVVLDRTDGKDASRWLEEQGVRVINRSNVSRLVRDKFATHQKLASFDIVQPEYFQLGKNTFEEIQDKLGLPFVVKDNYGQNGNKVFLIKNENDFLNVKKVVDESFLCQEFINQSYGFDIRCYFVGKKLCGVMKRVNKHGDFRSNLAQGGVGELFNLSYRQRLLAKRIRKILGLEFGSVDFLLKDNKLIFCEANSHAAFDFFLEKEIRIDDEILSYIKKFF